MSDQPYSVHRPAKNMGDAIKLFCRECMGAHLGFTDQRGVKASPHPAYNEVRDCPSEGMCSLWLYRFGKDPKRSQSAKKRDASQNLRRESD